MSSLGSTSNKKIKTTMNNTKDDFEILRKYISKCPLLKQTSPAIKAALEGMEKEEKRRIRDAKLKAKFGGNKTATSSSATSSALVMNDEIVVVEKESPSGSVILEATNNNNLNNSNSNIDDMEWQDVRQQQSDEEVPSARAIHDSFTKEDVSENNNVDDCFLGQTLAKACIDAIASQAQKNKPVQVSTPLAAVAVALHVSLRSEFLNFACTGIPETKPMKGFAPPIRELPKTEFLPKHWDTNPQSSPQALRYRKPDTGAVILTVEGHPSKEDSVSNSTICKVTFSPANRSSSSSKDSDKTCLEFPLDEHMNLDSWNAAALKSTNRKIAPSLHYKNLSGLLSKFCQTFDLGAVPNDQDNEMGGIVHPGYKINRNTKMEAPGVFAASSSFVSSSSSSNTMEARPRGYEVPTRLDQAFPSVPAAAAAARGNIDPMGLAHGDFSGDLLPAGLQDPRFSRMPGGSRMPGIGSGNLMGPNHPAFGHFPPGNFPGNIPMPGGPGTMQPRFDPIVPPCLGGGGDDLVPPGTRRPRARGEPNPDHLRPPNSLGNNMFM